MSLFLSRRACLMGALGAGVFASRPAQAQFFGQPADHTQVLSPDPMWTRFAATPIQLDRRTGAYTATFRPDVTSLAGRTLKILGFMLPLEAGRTTTHFGLMRKNHQCDFCPPSLPTEAIEVRLLHPRQNTTDLIEVSGVLSLHASSDAGFFFQIGRATAA
ncbi:hypothetical protein [Brevundimonas sp. SORGH_AS_0993]|uniref:hypothetical protein n=1 Tax=Brevundimonas sp. SORGH_AS_0993 TaxID=3041794 RepID=UPI0027847D52|nr:hypothetical protein [Brevundimonas sp. SORGH_AS_0993]MDQ1153396.1 hypothetical protein [Brevundimonas sp. SORGH_AS_0993]